MELANRVQHTFTDEGHIVRALFNAARMTTTAYEQLPDFEVQRLEEAITTEDPKRKKSQLTKPKRLEQLHQELFFTFRGIQGHHLLIFLEIFADIERNGLFSDGSQACEYIPYQADNYELYKVIFREVLSTDAGEPGPQRAQTRALMAYLLWQDQVSFFPLKNRVPHESLQLSVKKRKQLWQNARLSLEEVVSIFEATAASRNREITLTFEEPVNVEIREVLSIRDSEENGESQSLPVMYFNKKKPRQKKEKQTRRDKLLKSGEKWGDASLLTWVQPDKVTTEWTGSRCVIRVYDRKFQRQPLAKEKMSPYQLLQILLLAIAGRVTAEKPRIRRLNKYRKMVPLYVFLRPDMIADFVRGVEVIYERPDCIDPTNTTSIERCNMTLTDEELPVIVKLLCDVMQYLSEETNRNSFQAYRDARAAQSKDLIPQFQVLHTRFQRRLPL